jgi:hypothetical protein
MKRGLCFITKNVSTRCNKCSQVCEPCHVVTDGAVTLLLCPECCPEHKDKSLAASDGKATAGSAR